jgi:hypothetical protein
MLIKLSINVGNIFALAIKSYETFEKCLILFKSKAGDPALAGLTQAYMKYFGD